MAKSWPGSCYFQSCRLASVPKITATRQEKGFFMKKPSRRDTPNAATPQPGRTAKRNGKKEGRWEFTSSGSLFALGAVDAVRRAAYRTAGGELRFLPL
jgi:hypothetical protein